MPQNSRTVNDIIVRAYFLIGALSPDELPDAAKISEGLYYLNDVLDYFSSSGIYIPFVKNIQFTMVPGQDKYTVSNNGSLPAPDITADQLVSIEYCNIDRDNISYPVRIVNRSELFNNTRIANLKTRPGIVVLDRQELFSEIQFYPTPSFAYECNLRAKVYLDAFELQTTIEEVPRYWYRFLRYALGRELNAVYPSSNWTDKLEKEYETMFKQITASSDLDLTIYPDNILMTPFDELSYESFGITS